MSAPPETTGSAGPGRSSGRSGGRGREGAAPARAREPGGDCRFCRIVAGELEAARVYEDAATVAFLDRRPLFPGHVLVVPRAHHATLTDLPPELLGPLFGAARLLAWAVEEAVEAEGSFLALNNRVSQSVPHLHVHVVPRRAKDGLKGFFWPRHPYDDEAHLRRVQEAVRAAAARHAAPGPGRG